MKYYVLLTIILMPSIYTMNDPQNTYTMNNNKKKRQTIANVHAGNIQGHSKQKVCQNCKVYEELHNQHRDYIKKITDENNKLQSQKTILEKQVQQALQSMVILRSTQEEELQNTKIALEEKNIENQNLQSQLATLQLRQNQSTEIELGSHHIKSKAKKSKSACFPFFL